MTNKIKDQRSKIKPEEMKDQKTNKLVDLRAQVKKAKEELVGLQMEKIQGKLKNTSELTKKRKEIARLLTALRGLELIYAENV